MYFEQFYLACLSHASYMIGSDGIAAVIDPQRDVEIYLNEARKHALSIEHIIETHLHADFVSGHRELATLTGASIYIGAKADAKFPHVDVKDGDGIAFGRCRLRFLGAQGHTMEGISVLVTDLDRSPEPFGVLTGDTLFIGDVGRPDLSRDQTPQELAGLLFDSLHGKLLRLSDDVEVYPAHGGGSLCGKQISTERHSTIGAQRTSNYALQARTRDEFVRMLTAELPERPAYFAQDAEINRSGATALTELPPVPALPPAEIAARQNAGAIVLDTRPAAEFGAGHIPGSVHIGLSGQYASWAATLLGLDTEVILVAEDEEKTNESRLRLARVGIERVVGSLAGGIEAWRRAGLPLAQTPQISVQELQQLLSTGSTLQVIDVRRRGEWGDGHVRGAVLQPLDQLSLKSAAALDALDPAKPTAVHCKSGFRSSIATSLLQRAGFRHVMNVVGGFDEWKAANLPIVKPEQISAA